MAIIGTLVGALSLVALIVSVNQQGPGPLPGFSLRRTMSVHGVRRDKAALSSGCKAHPATAPAGSNRSSHGGNEVAEAFG
jgi:hypothetical protein